MALPNPPTSPDTSKLHALVYDVAATNTAATIHAVHVETLNSEPVGWSGVATHEDNDADAASQPVVLVAGTDGSNVLPVAVDASGNVQVDVLSIVAVDTELTTADLDTGAGVDTRAVVGLVLAESGGALLVGSANPVPVTAASLPLPSGSATSANQTTIIGHVDGIETLLTTIDTNTGTLAVVGGGAEATALRVTIASDSTGLISIDDGGNVITVDGTVDTELTTADLDTGAGVDTRAVVGLALAESGGALLVGSANPIPISGTVTSNIGTTNGLALDATLTDKTQFARLTDGTSDVTVRNLAANDALNVAIVDASGGHITSFGGGVQYTEAATDATITGTAVMWEDAADTLRAVSAAKPLPVDGSGVTQPVSAASLPLPTGAATETTLAAVQTAVELLDDVVFVDDTATHTTGATKLLGIGAAATPTDTAVAANDIGMLAMSLDRRLFVDADITASVALDVSAATVPISAASLPLPAGAATSAAQLGDGHNVATELPTAAALADTTANPTSPIVGAALEVFNGTTWDRARGDITNGLDVDVTRVGGTVTVTDDGSFTLAANSGVDIGDVDVVSVVPGTGATNLGKGIDLVAGASDVGVAPVAIRDDVLSALGPAEGDWAPLRVDGTGALHVTGGGLPAGAATAANQLADGHNVTVDNAAGASAVNIQDGGNSITVDGTVTANAGTGTFAISAASLPLPAGAATSAAQLADGHNVAITGGALTALDLIDDPVFADDAAFTLGTSKTMVAGAFVDASLTALAALDGDIVPFRVNGNGALHVTGGGGGTEYTEDAVAAANPLGGAQILIADSTPALEVAEGDNVARRGTRYGAAYSQIVDSSGAFVDTFGGGTQYTEDAVAATNPVGTAQILVADSTPALEVVDGDNVARRGTRYGAAYAQIVDSSGNFIDTFGGSGGTAMADDAAFTPAVTNVTPLGAFFDDVAPDSVDEGDAGVVRMSGNRNLYTTLRDAAGSERGVNVTASNELAVLASAQPGIDIGDVTINNASIAVTNAGTFATQVSGDALIALQLIDNLVLAEDSPHANLDPGVQMLAVRKATPADLSSLDGDYEPLQIDNGRLWVSGIVTDLKPGNGPTNLGKTIGGTAGGTDLGVAMMAIRDDVLTTLANADGTYNQLRTNSIGALHVAGDGVIDAGNSSTTPLGISGTFTGTGIDVSQYESIICTVITDETGSGAYNFKIEFSSDNTNWDIALDKKTVQTGSLSKSLTAPRRAQFMRVTYGNGATAQTFFRLQTILNHSQILDEGEDHSIYVLNEGNFAVQDNGTNTSNIAAATFVDDAGFTLTTSRVMMSGAIVDASLTALAAIDDDAVPLRVNANGALHVTGGGGGTEYTEDIAAATDPIGSAQILIADSTPALEVADGDNVARRGTRYGAAYTQIVDSSGVFVDTFGGGTQYTEGATDATITGTALMWEDAADVLATVSATNPLPVDASGVTVPVSAASLPLPAGAATSAGQLADGHNVTVDNASGASAVNIQDGGNTITVDNSTLAVVGGGTEAAALRVTLANDSTGLVSIDDGGGSLTIDGTVTASNTAGNVAHDAADSGNPVKIGAKVVNFDGTAPGTDAAENDRTDLKATPDGRLLVEQTHPNYWRSHDDYTVAQTNDTVKTAPGASLKIYITDVIISNGATAGNIILRDGSGGTILLEVYCAINGGMTHSFRTPIALSANTLLALTSTTVTTHSATITGFIAA